MAEINLEHVGKSYGEVEVLDGIDWKIDLGEARRRLGNDVGVQGNLDPAVLLFSPDQILLRAKEVLAQAGDAPVLIRIETRAGHGAGVPTDKVIEDYADRWAFLVRNLEMRLPEGYGE